MNEDVFNNQSANKQNGNVNSRWLFSWTTPRSKNSFDNFFPVTDKNNFRILIFFLVF
jgi:hypothetical protein